MYHKIFGNEPRSSRPKRSTVVTVPRKPRSTVTWLAPKSGKIGKTRARFRLNTVPAPVLANILKRLETRNVASVRTVLPKSNVARREMLNRKLKRLLNNRLRGTHNINPAYIQLVEGLKRRGFTNNEPIGPAGRFGVNLGYHQRRINNMKKLLDVLRLENNGYYHNRRGGRNLRYSFNKKHGRYLTAIPGNPRGVYIVVASGLKTQGNNKRLAFKYT